MPSFDTQTTVGQIVADCPGLSRVFEDLGIDFCCGGDQTLEAACQAKGLDPDTLVKVLAATASQPQSAPAVNVASMSMTEIVDHIEETHHAYLRQELPRLTGMAEKVREVHGESHPKFAELADVYAGLRAELEQHMMKEEQILFPFIRQIEGATELPSFHCGSLQNPIGVMIQEHDNAGQALARMSELTNGYTPPEDACNTTRALIDGLHGLQSDLHQHIHKENSILFPRAIEAEKELAAR